MKTAIKRIQNIGYAGFMRKTLLTVVSLCLISQVSLCGINGFATTSNYVQDVKPPIRKKITYRYKIDKSNLKQQESSIGLESKLEDNEDIFSGLFEKKSLASEAIDARRKLVEVIDSETKSIAEKWGIPNYVPVYEALMYCESGMNPDARSEDDAFGLSQMIKAEFDCLPTIVRIMNKKMGKNNEFNPTWDEFKINPRVQIEAGLLSFCYNVHTSSGNIKTALAKYNAGRTKVKNAWEKGGKIYDFNIYKEHLPKGVLKETGPYVSKIRDEYFPKINEKGFVDFVMDKEFAVIVNQYDNIGQKALDDKDYLKAMIIFQDLKETDKRNSSQMKFTVKIGQCYEGLGDLKNSQRFYKQAMDHYIIAKSSTIEQWNGDACMYETRLKEKLKKLQNS